MKPVLLLMLFCVTSASYALDLPGEFSEPPASYRLKKNYAINDPKNELRDAHLEKALKYYEFNKSQLPNDTYITLVDLSKHASTRRLFQINVDTGTVLSMLAAAGRGSDPDGDGNATEFSNDDGSHESSLGFYQTAEDDYQGENGKSLALFGLSRTNSLAHGRAIVIHGADYVTESRAGRSYGCPAVSNKNAGPLIDRLKGGSLLYIFFD